MFWKRERENPPPPLLGESLRGNRIGATGLRASERNLPLRGSLRGSLFSEIFERSSQRPSQSKISSEALSPVAPRSCCPLNFLQSFCGTFFRDFLEVFRGPLRDPLRGRFPLRRSCCPQSCCPLNFLQLL